jgi:hypothetical protein
MRLTAGKGIVMLLVAAIGAVGFAKHEDRVRQQDTLARIASELAGRKVGVRCPSFFGGLVDTHGEAGRVQFDADGRPAGHTDLSPETCTTLRRFGRFDFSCLDRGSCEYAEFQAGWAAHTLAHEAFHLRGFSDEAVTECYAVQNTAFVAAKLGLSRSRAEKLQQWIFTKGYPNEPSDYHSSQCYARGPLDLTPHDGRWP